MTIFINPSFKRISCLVNYCMNKKINIGIMGFGHIGRYMYENA